MRVFEIKEKQLSNEEKQNELLSKIERELRMNNNFQFKIWEELKKIREAKR